MDRFDINTDVNQIPHRFSSELCESLPARTAQEHTSTRSKSQHIWFCFAVSGRGGCVQNSRAIRRAHACAAQLSIKRSISLSQCEWFLRGRSILRRKMSSLQPQKWRKYVHESSGCCLPWSLCAKTRQFEKMVTSRALSEGSSVSANVHRNYFCSCGISFSGRAATEINPIVLEGHALC